MKTISWKGIEGKIDSLSIRPSEFDLVVAIARDGQKFGEFLSKKFCLPLEAIALRVYNEETPPKKIFSEPKLLEMPSLDVRGKRILLVDKIVKTGATMEKATQILNAGGAKKITPLVIAGQENYCLFKTGECIEFR